MRILIAYDGSLPANAAIDDMKRAGFPKTAEALVLSVAEGGLQAPQSIGMVQTEFTHNWKDKLVEAETLARSAAERVRAYFPEWKVTADASWGSPATVILEKVDKWNPDLLVVGSHGRSAVGRFFMGSVSLELVHKAACSVRVGRIGRSAVDGPLRLVVGNDGSKEAEAAVRAISGRSWPEKSEVHIVSVVETLVPTTELLAASTYGHDMAADVMRKRDENEERRLREVSDTSAGILNRAGLIAVPVPLDGDPRHEILLEAARWNADTIFVGARGLRGLDRLLLGSVSSHVVSHANCAVEVVRPNAYSKPTSI
jgi:nucleotide-binding universal stress UspA family protein